MTKSIQELFDYIANSKFNPEMFIRDLKAQKGLDINAHVGATKSTLLGQAAQVLNVAAVEILLKDFQASPNALTQGPVAQVWTPIYWTAYNSEKSASIEATTRLQILDLLSGAGANMEPLVKTSYYPASCNSLISYVKGGMIQDFLLHGASPYNRNAEGLLKLAKDIPSTLDRINSNITDKPAEYLYITALHKDIALRLSSDVEAKALAALKNGAAPKIGNTYTTKAFDLLDKIAQEFIQDPSLFLKTTLHADSKIILEQSLVNLGSTLEKIEAQSYKNLTHTDLTHEAVDPQVEGSYTDNASNALDKLAEELNTNPTLLLYYTLHDNSVREITGRLQKLDVALKEVYIKAKEALENGASPREGVEEYTENAKLALAKIASDIKTNPMKFLSVTLHDYSKSHISELLEKNKSSIDAIKNQVNDGLKHGKSLKVSDESELTPNALEAIGRLATELKADPKLWLHISLSEDALAPLSAALEQAEYSLDQVKEAAVNILKNGENPETKLTYTDNALEALAILKTELFTDPVKWLYVKLEKHAEKKLEYLELDLDEIRIAAKLELQKGIKMSLEGKPVTSNATSLITELANDYMLKNEVPRDAFFHKGVKDFIESLFTLSGHPDLMEQLKTDSSIEIEDAINTQAPEGSPVSVKATKPSDVEASTTWTEYFFGKSSAPVDTGKVETTDSDLASTTRVESFDCMQMVLIDSSKDNSTEILGE